MIQTSARVDLEMELAPVASMVISASPSCEVDASPTRFGSWEIGEDWGIGEDGNWDGR